jgi:hypothetical protein
MITKQKSDIERKLRNLADDISISDSVYEEAKRSYEAVGDWLADDNSPLKKYQPKIYPQGSFAFGTAIKPQEGCDHDVDAVCLLQATTNDLTQKRLKELVGNRLKEHGTYSQMIKPKTGGRRCWTLEFADNRNFHIDILPAIPDNTINFNSATYKNEISKHAINLTDKEHDNYEILSNNWLKSNPQGYVNWFKNEMRKKMASRTAMEFAANESVEDLPLYKQKSVLQKAIQLLKYHRDINWGGDDNKPISIIITTLATKAYNGEDNLYDALSNICKTMSNYIENCNGVYLVKNPVNSEENFADKWEETPKKKEVYFQWLNSLNKLFADLLDESINFPEALDNAYGNKRQSGSVNYSITPKSKYMSNPIAIFNVPYRKAPLWPMQNMYSADISATFKKNNAVYQYESNGSVLPKDGSIRFTVDTDAPQPFNVQWQILNTGDEARAGGQYQLRGGFYSSEDGINTRQEHTKYKGSHMAQAYVIKNGVCVAKSEEFVVNIT